MISNQILQNTISGLKEITRCDLSITDRDGKVIVSTEQSMIGKVIDNIPNFVSSQAEGQILKNYNYFKVFDNNVVEYVVAAKSEYGESYKIAQVAAFQLKSLIMAYKERYDKENFIKNLLLDNLLLVDIYSRAEKLNIENKVPRVVYLIQTDIEENTDILDLKKSVFDIREQDFLTLIDEKNIILVRELDENDSRDEIEKVARDLNAALTEKLGADVYISLGTIVNNLKNISLSYKEAKMAMEVGKIFNIEGKIINYQYLGVVRLIYQLPTSLCKIFITEVLHGFSTEQLDQELITTVAKFFENNLNVSETSRQLYIHRNTLVYRLDKIQKMTGLDLRIFDDAVIFKVALMVLQYMDYKEKYIY